MKKINVFFMLITCILLLGIETINAQSTPDYFTGDWKITVIGIPGGDSEMIMHLEKADGKYNGNISSTSNKSEAIKIDRVEQKESAISVFFFAQGYDICLYLEKQDENNIKGNMFDMFDAKGQRILE